MDKQELIALLERTIEAVKADDSFEGRIVYAATEWPGVFSVQAAVRVGNSQGQGGMMLVQDRAANEYDITVKYEEVDGVWYYVGRVAEYPDFTVYEDSEDEARHEIKCLIEAIQ